MWFFLLSFVCFSNVERLICARTHGHALMYLWVSGELKLEWGFFCFVFFTFSRQLFLSWWLGNIQSICAFLYDIYPIVKQGWKDLHSWVGNVICHNICTPALFLVTVVYLFIFYSRMVAWGKQHCCCGRIQDIFLRFRIVLAVLLLHLFLATAGTGKTVFSWFI